jgi:hypothetical protein
MITLSLHDHLSDKGLDKWIAELGCNNALVPRQGIRNALAFFAHRMPVLPVKDAVSFLAAMDLSKAVKEVTLNPGDRVIGFRTASESPFKLFFARRGASMHSSGINTAERGPVHFKVREAVLALESFTTGTKDSWTPSQAGQRVGVSPRSKKWFGKEFGLMVAGGGVQLIIPESVSSLLVESP